MLFPILYLVPSLLLILQASAFVHLVARQNGNSSDACTSTCEPYDVNYKACNNVVACFCTPAMEANLEACVNCHLKLTPDQETVNMSQDVIDSFENYCSAYSLPTPKVTFPPGLTPATSAASTQPSGSATTVRPTTTKPTTPITTVKPTTIAPPSTIGPPSTITGPTTASTPRASPTAGSNSGGSSLHIGVVHAGVFAAVLMAFM